MSPNDMSLKKYHPHKKIDRIQTNSRRLWRSRRRKSSSVPAGAANFPAAVFPCRKNAQTSAGIAFRAAGKSVRNFPAASKFARKLFQQGISDSHSLFEFSEGWNKCLLYFLGSAFCRTDSSRNFCLGAAGFCRGFCRRIFSPHSCGIKCPEKSSRKIPGKILQILYNKNPRHISAEGPGQNFFDFT